MTAWLFTFLVHSTLWCGTAWLCLRFFPRTHARLRETIWYTALAASLVTPTTHSFMSPGSAVWRLPMPSFAVGAEPPHVEAERGYGDGTAAVSTPSREEAHGEERGVNPGWLASAGSLWLTLAGGLLALYVLRLETLRRRLVRREPVADSRASQALVALGNKAALDPPPRLTESHNLGSPIALGVGTRREICVPARALHELNDGELRALLGHEVAHHLRRDTIRLGILNVLRAVFFFQPLFRIAAQEIQLAAEEQCDDWAASQFEDRLAMASCLTEVARWVVPRDRSSPVPCIGRRRSQLALRVRRLVEERRALQAPSRAWQRASSMGLLVLAPLFAPAVAPAGDESHEDRHVVGHLQPQQYEQLRERWHERERREHRPVAELERREHRQTAGTGSSRDAESNTMNRTRGTGGTTNTTKGSNH